MSAVSAVRSLYCFIPTSSRSLGQCDGSAQVHLVFPSEVSLFPTVFTELTNNNQGTHQYAGHINGGLVECTANRGVSSVTADGCHLGASAFANCRIRERERERELVRVGEILTCFRIETAYLGHFYPY